MKLSRLHRLGFIACFVATLQLASAIPVAFFSSGGSSEWSGWSGLTHYYPLAEASGNAIDAVGSSDFTEVNTVPQVTVGMVDNARDFNGSNDYFSLTAGASTPLRIADTAKTIAVWLRPETANRQFLGGYSTEWNLRYSATRKLEFYNAKSGTTATSTNGASSENEWILCVIYHDPTANTFAVSYNGQTPDTVSYTGGFNTTSTVEYFGAYANYHDGMMGPVMVWDRVLTDTEITELYRSGAGRFKDASNVEVENFDLPCFAESTKGSTARLHNRSRHLTQTSVGHDAARSLSGKSSGKWYFEATIEAGGNNTFFGVSGSALASTNFVGQTATSWGFNDNQQTWTNGSSTGGYTDAATNDIFGCAVDLDTGEIWFSINNTWINSGDPAAGTGEVYGTVSGTVYPAASVYNTTDAIRLNAPFTYSPPSGFSEWTLE